MTWAEGDVVDVKLIETATATFDSATYSGTESVDVTVTLGEAFTNKLTLDINVETSGGATGADYSLSTDELVFAAGDTEKTFTVTVTDDTVDDDDESITLSFDDNHIRPAGTNETATVTLIDNDAPFVKVEFGQDSQGVGEGETVNVTVTLDADPERTVTIPVTSSPQDTASTADYTVPASVTFARATPRRPSPSWPWMTRRTTTRA